MAASFSLSRIETNRVWLSLIVLFVALFSLQAYQIYKDSRLENQQVVESQLKTLLRARVSDLQNKNYRNFVEGVGEEFKELRIIIDAGTSHFEIGPKYQFENCASSGFPSIASSAENGVVTVQICRKFSSPMSRFFILIPVFFAMVCFAYRAKKREIETAKKQALFELAEQVAHDIRSPLAALKTFEADLPEISEDKRANVRKAVSRIGDIANDLLNKYNMNSASENSGSGSEPATVENISGILASVMMEKRLQFRSRGDIKIGAHKDFCLESFAVVQPIEFSRLISNLINNAVEACGESGTVQIAVASDPSNHRIVIQDSGKGIPKELLPRLGRRGETFGKVGGSGLGLFHAKQSVERWGGSLSIDSSLGVGTKVVITLPSSRA